MNDISVNLQGVNKAYKVNKALLIALHALLIEPNNSEWVCLQFRYGVGRSLQLIPLSFVAHFSKQVAMGLSYMHLLNIVHRDLKPAKVLLTEDLTVKVADMTLSRLSCKQMSPSVGTELYRAPELFE